MTSRRNFIKTTGSALGSAVLLSPLPMGLTSCSPAPTPFGFQVWTLREQLFADLEGTLKKLAGMGYTEVEMCSPIGYKGSFDRFADMGGIKMRKIIEGQGLICESSHYGMGELRDKLQQSIDWSLEMGIKQVVCSSFWLPKDCSMDDYRRSCDELNEIAVKVKEAGMQAGFHNHHMEFDKIDGELVYDVLLEELDPELVKMQFQVAVVNIGYKAADYFRKYPGRFFSAHLSDWSKEDPEKAVPIGQGIVDWDEFYEAASVGGVQNYFVEMAPETYAASAGYLATR